MYLRQKKQKMKIVKMNDFDVSINKLKKMLITNILKEKIISKDWNI